MPNLQDAKLYAQLRPDQATLRHLRAIQDGLVSTSGRPIPPPQLHLTLIHFGKVRDMYEAISAAAPLQWQAYQELLTAYVAATEQALPLRSYELQPQGLARFGERGGTLVIEYQPTTEIVGLHSKLYDILKQFLAGCGIVDVAKFAAHDFNLQHANIIRPHITLYKGYGGEIPACVLQPVYLQPMPVVYQRADS